MSAAATRGVSEIAIQGVTGHRSVAVLRSYVRRATLFDELNPPLYLQGGVEGEEGPFSAGCTAARLAEHRGRRLG